MSDKRVDLFVIGAGSGGVRAARIAATHGASVAIAESFRFGGTCVIRGCVPKKLMVLASRLKDEFDRADAYGWTVGSTEFNWDRLRDAKETEITRLEAAYLRNLKAVGVQTYANRAFISGKNEVTLEESGEVIHAEKILIATGGWPAKTDIPGAELAITSNEIFDLAALPDALVIEGGGFIGVEFACVMQRLGVSVTLVYRGEQILRGFDDDLRNHLANAMREAGIDVLVKTRITSITGQAGSLTAHLDNGNTVSAGQVMLATGRKPAIDNLGLRKAGVTVNDKGAIEVSADSRTSNENIWAVGDVTNRLALTPVAIREGHAFADTVFGNNPWVCDHNTVPSAVFSTPEIGTVGLTEAQAREAYADIDIYRTSFRPMTNVLCDFREEILMKLVVDKASDRVLGVHICGPDAAEMVQVAAIPLKMGATKAQFDSAVALHPSAAEELVTMRTPVSA